MASAPRHQVSISASLLHCFSCSSQSRRCSTAKLSFLAPVCSWECGHLWRIPSYFWRLCWPGWRLEIQLPTFQLIVPAYLTLNFPNRQILLSLKMSMSTLSSSKAKSRIWLAKATITRRIFIDTIPHQYSLFLWTLVAFTFPLMFCCLPAQASWAPNQNHTWFAIVSAVDDFVGNITFEFRKEGGTLAYPTSRKQLSFFLLRIPAACPIR